MKYDECSSGARVICVDKVFIHYLSSIGSSNIIGNIYVVNYVGGIKHSYMIMDDNSNLLGGLWFDLLSWDIYTGLTTIPMTGFKITVPAKSKECPCGIARTDCNYHNGKN
jgi:hypothetical protein